MKGSRQIKSNRLKFEDQWDLNFDDQKKGLFSIHSSNSKRSGYNNGSFTSSKGNVSYKLIAPSAGESSSASLRQTIDQALRETKI